SPTTLSPVTLSLLISFTHTATTEIYTLSLHDALPISGGEQDGVDVLVSAVGPDDLVPVDVGEHRAAGGASDVDGGAVGAVVDDRSEEHTSELQSRENLVCRLLLEKKNKDDNSRTHRKS